MKEIAQKLLPFFPLQKMKFHDDPKINFIIVLLIYLFAGTVLSIVFGFLFHIPVIGLVLSIVMWLLDIYCLIGIILKVLDFIGALS